MSKIVILCQGLSMSFLKDTFYTTERYLSSVVLWTFKRLSKRVGFFKTLISVYITNQNEIVRRFGLGTQQFLAWKHQIRCSSNCNIFGMEVCIWIVLNNVISFFFNCVTDIWLYFMNLFQKLLYLLAQTAIEHAASAVLRTLAMVMNPMKMISSLLALK